MRPWSSFSSCKSSFEQLCWAAWFVGELIGQVSPIEFTSPIVARKPAQIMPELLLLVSVLGVISRAGVAELHCLRGHSVGAGKITGAPQVVRTFEGLHWGSSHLLGVELRTRAS